MAAPQPPQGPLQAAIVEPAAEAPKRERRRKAKLRSKRQKIADSEIDYNVPCPECGQRYMDCVCNGTTEEELNA